MIRLTQTTSLQQKMAPQLIQSLRLLQMPTLELGQMIQQELEINPLLELGEDQDLDAESESESEDESSQDADDDADGEDDPDELDNLEELEFEEKDLNDEEFDEQDWSEYLNDAGYAAPREERDPNVEEWEDTGAIQESLEDSLREQLHMSELTPGDMPVAEFIIGNIDEDGFFKSSVEDIADTLGVEPEEVERVLQIIQTFEPAGVGARNLTECLLIQLRTLGDSDAIKTVMAIVKGHLDDLVNRRYSKICRALGVDKEDISHAYDVISTLNPKPGFTPEPRVNPNLVVPDLEVMKVGEEWVVSLTDRNVPSLRVNPLYRTLLNQTTKTGNRDAKKFVVDKLNSAKWFIQAINQRRTTMLKVMRCIVENQIDFFEHGIGHLRPMVLQEVADKVGMHVSTISRVSNGKYVQMQYGVFELKYFFDGGLSRDDGDDISAKSVKEKISKLIHEEPTENPLSDQKIADILKEEGIDIARRTVAKYRDQLKINPARYRKAI